MKTALIVITIALVGFAGGQTSSPDSTAGYAIGKSDGEEWASLGQGVATPKAMEAIADTKFQALGKGDASAWKSGFKSGYDAGFNEAKRTWRSATASSGKYDQPSYWAGYKAGYGSTHVEGTNARACSAGATSK